MILTKLFCTSGPNLVVLAKNRWWVIARTSSKWGKFWLWSWIWPWRSRSITLKNNKDLSQSLLRLWSKFGDLNLNGSQIIARTSKWLTHRLTHTQTQATTIPVGQYWHRVKLHELCVKPLGCTMHCTMTLCRIGATEYNTLCETL